MSRQNSGSSNKENFLILSGYQEVTHMNELKKLRGMLFTLGNVKVNSNTKYSFPNSTPDPRTNRRSQELYDALYQHLNLTAWACGRYGQHAYSPELGQVFAKELSKKLENEPGLEFDYSIQMAGHPIFHHKKPYFIIVDYIPYFDLSIMDHIAFPCIKKSYERDQDFLYKEATGIITYTPVQRYMLINWLDVDPTKVTSICSGVNDFIGEEDKKKNTKKILWVGADFEQKGGSDVLKAFEILRKKDPEYTMTMVGINESLDSIPGVTVYPFLSDQDLSILDKLYSEAAIFVMPSYKENLGLVYLEAMAHKTPVVVTTRGGLAEVVRRTGTGEVVPPGQIQMIVEAIEKVLDPLNYEAYSERAYYFALHNAAWEIASKRMVDAIERWLNNKPVPDDYIDYTMNRRVQFYDGLVEKGLR